MDYLEEQFRYYEKTLPNNPTAAIMVLAEVLIAVLVEKDKEEKAKEKDRK